MRLENRATRNAQRHTPNPTLSIHLFQPIQARRRTTSKGFSTECWALHYIVRMIFCVFFFAFFFLLIPGSQCCYILEAKSESGVCLFNLQFTIHNSQFHNSLFVPFLPLLMKLAFDVSPADLGAFRALKSGEKAVHGDANVRGKARGK